MLERDLLDNRVMDAGYVRRLMKHDELTQTIYDHLTKDRFKAIICYPKWLGLDIIAKKSTILYLIKTYSGSRRLTRKAIDMFIYRVLPFYTILSEIILVVPVIYLETGVGKRIQEYANRYGVELVTRYTISDNAARRLDLR